jgi:hypothetical protein
MGIKAAQRERLQRAVSGAVLLPGEGGYADATRTWDLAVGSCPPVALVAASAADIAAGARWAKRERPRYRGAQHRSRGVRSLRGSARHQCVAGEPGGRRLLDAACDRRPWHVLG